MSLAHFWKIVMISSQPSEQYGFTTLFLFLLFLNSDIGIVILYIVKYIRKAFSLPKKINFEVQNLTNIHVFRFAFSDLYCYHTDLQNARNAVSDNLIFKISPPPALVGPYNQLIAPTRKKSWLRAWYYSLLSADSQQLRISAHRASRLNLMKHNKTVLFYVLLDIFSFLCNETTVNLY